MFVRWVVRGHKNSKIANVVFHDAYLVESYRNDEGEPRQRTISYLGNVRQIGEEFPSIERELFLLRAEHILSSIDELSPADRDQTMEQLQKRIQPLDEDEMMIGFKNTMRWYYRWWQENGGMPTDEQILNWLKFAKDTTDQMQMDSWNPSDTT